MKLYLDPSGGMAGDMFTAGLMDAGVPAEILFDPMIRAASRLGEISIKPVTREDGSLTLNIKLDHTSDHLEGRRAERLLKDTFKQYNLPSLYRELGMKMLAILLAAEEKAHRLHHIEVPGHHHHGEPVLHEAQDVVIDILGAAFGLYYLDILPPAAQLSPVSLGRGEIDFSHGRFPVPAPATASIISDHNLATRPGPVEGELFTPTGAAILAALAPFHPPEGVLETCTSGASRGSRELDIPPFRVYICPVE